MPDFDYYAAPGPIGAGAFGEDRTQWRLWAPHAKLVELILHDRHGEQAMLMRPEPGGCHVHVAARVPEGLRYDYRLDGGPPRPDPASRWQPDGVHMSSAVFYPEAFDWSEADWRGIERSRLVIYELHVGTFTNEGTLDAVVGRLTDLVELGVTAIELMPLAQFPGERNWGYDGVHPFAVQHSYGGPRALQRLVNAAHAAGLAVILDVVHNHLGPEGNYLAEFGPYFSDRTRTPWGPAFNFDRHGCDGARAFVLENVRHWIRDFRLDGLRLDAVQTIFDAGARHILGEIKRAADEEAARLGRVVHVIAESSLNDTRILDPAERGGYALDLQWSDDFHHAVHALLTAEERGYYADFGSAEHLVKALNQTFVIDGCYSKYRGRRHGAPTTGQAGDRFVVAVQNHDQVGNRSLGDRFGTLLDPPRARLAAGLLLLSPHVPLLFMGEEYGETRPFPFFCSFHSPQLGAAVTQGRRAEFAAFGWPHEPPDAQDERTFFSAKLNWAWPDGSGQAALRRFYSDLLATRRAWPALADFTNFRAELLPDSGTPGVLKLVRGTAPSAVECYFNLGSSNQRLDDAWRKKKLLLSSEFGRYGGTRSEEDSEPRLAEFEVCVWTA